MYLKINEKNYPCTGMPALSGETLRFFLPGCGEDAALVALLTGAPSGALGLYQDDGFQIWETDVGGYPRWKLEGEALVITNTPEPGPVPPPPEPEPRVTIETLAGAVVDLQYDVDKLKLERMAT